MKAWNGCSVSDDAALESTGRRPAPPAGEKGRAFVDWDEISHVLLDLDGTLLNIDFDDYFWQKVVPRVLAKKRGVPLEEAEAEAFRAYRKEEGNLNWYDVRFWSRCFDLDLSLLQRRLAHRVALHPDAEAFLQFVRKKGRPMYLVTNAHPDTLACKLDRCSIRGYFARILSAFDVGCPKEEVEYWKRASRVLRFDPGRSLLVDDNSRVLHAAKRFGIAHPIHKARASGTRAPLFLPGWRSIRDLRDLIDTDEKPHVQTGRGETGAIDPGIRCPEAEKVR